MASRKAATIVLMALINLFTRRSDTSARRRRVVRRSLIGFMATLTVMAAQIGIGGTLAASASTAGGCDNGTCRWTQLENGNWPDNSSDPSCSPCASWPVNGDGSVQNVYYFNAWQGQGSMFENETNWAANTWGNEPYESPTTEECNGCGTSITYNAQSMASNLCGQTYLSYNVTQGGQAAITGATVYLNTNAADGYVDGPSDSRACDLRDTLLHETGHVFGEGHSSVNSDLMYPATNNVESVDQDAEDMMAEVYGSYEAGCTSDYCGGNADINVPSPVVLHPMTSAQLEQVLLNKAADARNAYLAEKADAVNMVNSMEQQVWPQPFAQTAPPPPPGSVTIVES